MKKLLLVAAAVLTLTGCAARPTPELLCENLKSAFELVCEYELSGQRYTMSLSRAGAESFSAELYMPAAPSLTYTYSEGELSISHAGVTHAIDPAVLPRTNVFMGLADAFTRASPERCVSCEMLDDVAVFDFGDVRISAVNSVPVAVEWGAIKIKITAFTP